MGASAREDKRKTLQRISGQIEKYVHLHDKLALGSKPDAYVRAGAQKVPRKDGKAPMGAAAIRWLSDPDNADAARKIEPAIRELRHGHATYGGISLYEVICIAGYGGARGVDFAEFRRWERKETDDARKHYGAYQAALDMLARIVYSGCERIGISPEMCVNVKGDDGKSEEHAESKDAAAKQDAAATKQMQKEARDERIRLRYAYLKAETEFSEAHIRERLRLEFAPRGKERLNRETVNSALRAPNGTAA